jgi:hypothetical protein
MTRWTRFLLLASLLVSGALQLEAGYTTPNTGVVWTLDSLVLHSGGTLTGAFPNYTLNDTLSVAQNDRLTFQSGSIITVTSGTGKGFTVYGILRAVGTPTDSIVIKGATPTAGLHRGFRFDETSVDSACVIAYCRIQDAVDAVYCFNANTTITNSLFTNNSSNGVRCYGSSPVIGHCTFVENRQSAISANVNSSPIITGNILARNNSQNTSARNQIAIGGQGTNNPIITGNEIYNQSYFRAGGIGLVTLSASDVCSPVIEGNYIHHNGFGIVVQGLTAGGTLRPVIRNNRIEYNKINPDSMNAGSGIAVYIGGPSNAPIIAGNTIIGNFWGVTCVSSTGLANSPRPNLGDLSNADTSDDGWNIFLNNGNGGRIYQLYNNGTQNISAQNNYWGSTDSTIIESYITHRTDSTVFGFVNYLPFGRPGMGTPDTLALQQIGSSLGRLTWHFSAPATGGVIQLFNGPNPSTMTLIATLPDTQQSFLATLQEGLWYFGISSSNRFGTTDTTIRYLPFITPSVGGTKTIAGEFSLAQNFPNPFNPSTTIRYALPADSRVTLTLFDLLGREVAILVNEKQSAGFKSVVWNAAGFSSGIYFCRLKAGNNVSITKLLLER